MVFLLYIFLLLAVFSGTSAYRRVFMILWYDASYDKSSIHQLFLLEILGGILASVLYNKVFQKLSLRKILVISMILLVDAFLLQWVFSSFCFWGTFLTSFLLNFIEISIKNLGDNLELNNKQLLFSDFIWNLSKMIGTASIKFGETMLPIAIALTNSASFPLILLDFKKNKNYSSITILELFKKNEKVVIGVIICNVIEFLINNSLFLILWDLNMQKGELASILTIFLAGDFLSRFFSLKFDFNDFLQDILIFAILLSCAINFLYTHNFSFEIFTFFLGFLNSRIKSVLQTKYKSEYVSSTFILDSQIKHMSFLIGLILSKIFFWFSSIGFIRFLPFLYGIILVLF